MPAPPDHRHEDQTMTIRPRRSVLYMPGSNARALEKAREIAVDGLILDLEDAVAPDAKELARQQVVDAVSAGGYGPREIVIRTNAPGTAWFEADLAASVAAKPDAILIPKVETPETLITLGHRLDALKADPAIRVWAMVETPLAILNVEAIARAARNPATRLACFVMGTNDLVKDMRARFVPGRAPVMASLTMALLAARAHGLDILDGVYNALKDEEGFAAECAQGRDMGFDGKTLIHPAQAAAANATFGPSADEVANAAKLAAAFDLPENHGKGAITLDGRMVERLHAEMAKRVLALADAIAARG
jgi:citrate lyase subunit beta / citryl-CoA lyase